MRKQHLSLVTIIATAIIYAVFTSAPVYSQDFYKGKTLHFIVGFSAGGGFDTYSRTIARHIGKHIPGNPTVIVENMTGAGSLIAANHVYRVAKPDGLTIAHFIGGLIMGQILGRTGIEFDARKFEWIGVPAKLEAVCALTKASGIASVEEWRSSKTPAKLGATGPGSETYDVPRILEVALGLPTHIVSGYKGTADIRVAAEGGEIAGTCWGWEVMKVQWRKALDASEVNVVVQALPKAHPDLPKVPLAISFAKSSESRQLIRVGIHDQSEILRPYALPPGTPRERVRILRKAFQDTMKDPEFLAEARKAKLSIDPLTGEELENIVKGFFEITPSLVDKLKNILLPTK